MNNILNINKIHSDFRSWRVADARVVGGKNTNNGRLRLLLKLNNNNGTNRIVREIGASKQKNF